MQQKKNNNKRLITHVSYPIADQVLRHHMMHTESNLYIPNGCTHTRKREREREIDRQIDSVRDTETETVS